MKLRYEIINSDSERLEFHTLLLERNSRFDGAKFDSSHGFQEPGHNLDVKIVKPGLTRVL